MEKRFKPEVGAFVKILFVLIEAVIIVSLFFVGTVGKGVLIGLFVLVGCFFVPLFVCTFYQLQEKYLYIRYAFLPQKIDYESITSVQKLTVPTAVMSSLSLSRRVVELKIRQEGRRDLVIYISPAARDEFVDALCARCKFLDKQPSP